MSAAQRVVICFRASCPVVVIGPCPTSANWPTPFDTRRSVGVAFAASQPTTNTGTEDSARYSWPDPTGITKPRDGRTRDDFPPRAACCRARPPGPGCAHGCALHRRQGRCACRARGGQRTKDLDGWRPPLCSFGDSFSGARRVALALQRPLRPSAGPVFARRNRGAAQTATSGPHPSGPHSALLRGVGIAAAAVAARD